MCLTEELWGAGALVSFLGSLGQRDSRVEGVLFVVVVVVVVASQVSIIVQLGLLKKVPSEEEKRRVRLT